MPTLTQVDLVIPGDPIAKGRPRFARGGHAYTPKRTADAEREIKAAAQEVFYKPWECPVGMRMTFYCKTKRRTDGDNLAKLVSDALNGVAFVDDYLVEESYWRLYRSAPDEEPRTEVTIYELED